MYLSSEAERAQRDLDADIDREAARIIRERGIGLWDAIAIAKRNIRNRRSRETQKPQH